MTPDVPSVLDDHAGPLFIPCFSDRRWSQALNQDFEFDEDFDILLFDLAFLIRFFDFDLIILA